MVPYNSFLSFVQQSVKKGFCADIFLSNSQCSLLTSWRDSRNLVCTKEKVIHGVPRVLDVPLPRIVVVAALSACSRATRWSNLPGGEGTGSCGEPGAWHDHTSLCLCVKGPSFFFHSCRTWLNRHCVPEPVLGVSLSDQFEKEHQNLSHCVGVRGGESREAGGQGHRGGRCWYPTQVSVNQQGSQSPVGWVLAATGPLLPSSRVSFTLQTQNRLNCFSRVWLFVTLWTVARRAPLSMGFSRQEYWSWLPFLTLGDLPDPRIKPASLTSPELAGRFSITSTTCEALKTDGKGIEMEDRWL